MKPLSLGVQEGVSLLQRLGSSWIPLHGLCLSLNLAASPKPRTLSVPSGRVGETGFDSLSILNFSESPV